MNAEEVPEVIEVKHLTRRFRRKCALDDVSMGVPRGCVFGLLGENGAGKTTLIKHLLGSYTAKTGSVCVFGEDPVTNPVGVLSRVGYLSEEREMPHWMRIHQVGLLVALAHRPELLVLDEPSSGLDPIVRHDILTAIVRTVASEGRTVFFSSHLLEEVERVSDRIAMMVNGKVVIADSLDSIMANHHQWTIRFETPQEKTAVLEGALSCRGRGKEWNVICNGETDRLVASVLKAKATIVDERGPSLEEIFFAQAEFNTQPHEETAP